MSFAGKNPDLPIFSLVINKAIGIVDSTAIPGSVF